MKVLITAVLLGVVISQAFAQTWATATSTNSQNGRVIVFRFIDELGSGFDTSSQPDRIIIQWKYEAEAGRGMPVSAEHRRMDDMEDLLEPAVSVGGFATLALVSTGERLREWVYYAKDSEEFMARLNRALAGEPPFPLEIHLARDPEWDTWTEFKRGIKR